MHQRFEFVSSLRTVPYAVINVSPDDTLLIVSTEMTADMPIWLREHLSNAVYARLHTPVHRCTTTSNVIDFTAARALRTAPIRERRGETRNAQNT